MIVLSVKWVTLFSPRLCDTVVWLQRLRHDSHVFVSENLNFCLLFHSKSLYAWAWLMYTSNPIGYRCRTKNSNKGKGEAIRTLKFVFIPTFQPVIAWVCPLKTFCNKYLGDCKFQCADSLSSPFLCSYLVPWTAPRSVFNDEFNS